MIEFGHPPATPSKHEAIRSPNGISATGTTLCSSDSTTTLGDRTVDHMNMVVPFVFHEKRSEAGCSHAPLELEIKPQEKFSWWKNESASWLMSAVCLACVIGTFIAYHNKEMPHWPHGISLNTVVAILATIEMLFLEGPIASSLAQLKWNWFDRVRPLIDFITIENASQGPFGSLKLLIRRAGGPPSILGALLLLTNLAIPTFLQQALSYQETSIRTGEASITTRRWFAPGHTSPSVAFGMALYGAFGGLPAANPVPSSCTTGNCTWDDYESLAICGRCNNITNYLDQFGNLPGQLGLHLEDVDDPKSRFRPRLKFKVNLGKPKSFSKSEIMNHILHILIVSLTDRVPKAEECILSFCTATFNATEVKGHLIETRKKESQPWNAKIVSTWGANPSKMDPQPEFFASKQNMIDNYFSTTFNGRVLEIKREKGNLAKVFIWDSGLQAAQSAYGYQVFNNFHLSHDPMNITRNIWHTYGTETNGTLEPLIQDAADRLTKVLRKNSSSEIGKTYSKFYNVTGAAYETKTLVRVGWGWIVLPITLEILALAFLFMVMTDTSRRKFDGWRGENLFLLLHGLEESLRTDLRETADIKTLEKLANSVVVRLRKTDNGWRLARSSEPGEDDEKPV